MRYADRAAGFYQHLGLDRERERDGDGHDRSHGLFIISEVTSLHFEVSHRPGPHLRGEHDRS